MIERLAAEIGPAYEKEMGMPLSYYVASFENGTEVVTPKIHDTVNDFFI